MRIDTVECYSQFPETAFAACPCTWQGMVDVATDLMPELANVTTLGKITLPVPLLAKLEHYYVIPVVQAPVRLQERLMGLAEYLDDPVLDVVPVMPRVRQAVAVDPLPWEQ